MARKIFRKKLIIDPVQYKILAVILIYSLTGIIISALMIFLPAILSLNSPESAIAQQQAAREIVLLNKRFWPVILTVTVLIAIHSILLFHRIFGPLYRFRSIFRLVAEGDLRTVAHIRKNDFLHEEEVAIRDMITSLKTRIGATRSSQENMHQKIAELEEVVQKGELSSEELSQQLMSLKQQSLAIGKELQLFKV